MIYLSHHICVEHNINTKLYLFSDVHVSIMTNNVYQIEVDKTSNRPKPRSKPQGPSIMPIHDQNNHQYYTGWRCLAGREKLFRYLPSLSTDVIPYLSR